MHPYSDAFNTHATPQSEPIPGSKQVSNHAGGFTFEVDDWTRLDRFLILGAEGGTYYVAERPLVKDNAQAVLRCIAADGARTVQRILEISEAGRAPKNTPALFALGLALKLGNEPTRRAAAAAVPKVARIGTHLFQLVEALEALGGWSRVTRRAVAQWYTEREPSALAYQAIKYQQREGWSHRDLLRLAHPKATNVDTQRILHWLVKGWPDIGPDAPHDATDLLWAFEATKKASTAEEIVRLISAHRLPREAIPTQWLNEPSVWEALLFEGGADVKMPITALVRSLSKLTTIGVLKPMGPSTMKVAAAISDEIRLKAGRVHPVAMLIALKTYASGHGLRGSGTWTPVREIVDALDAGFYAAFGAVESTGKRRVLALDVSGSMSSPVAGTPLSAREAVSALAMVAARTEQRWTCVAFTAGRSGYGGRWGGDPSGLTVADISPRQRLDDVCRKTAALPMGGTDCSLPMVWAAQNGIEADSFEVMTDNETWAGKIHPVQALKAYRQKMGIPAKLIVHGTTATEFSIADPSDAGMLDVVGFDAGAPNVVADFIRR